jgi:hypothetical protein
MARAPRASRAPIAVLAAIAIASTALAGWLYRDNRRLADEIARARPAVAAPAPVPATAAPATASSPPARAALPSAPPRLPPSPPRSQTRMERRSQRSLEVAALLGRGDDETEDEYRARILPLMKMALAQPRQNAEDMRRLAEEKAGVTPAQHAALDAAFAEVYDDVITYTNGAISDGQLTPYQRNVAGMLEYAGGLGAILDGAEQRVDKVLRPEQRRTMYEAGFEWGEYLGVSAPWESLKPPPPPPSRGGS